MVVETTSLTHRFSICEVIELNNLVVGGKQVQIVHVEIYQQSVLLEEYLNYFLKEVICQFIDNYQRQVRGVDVRHRWMRDRGKFCQFDQEDPKMADSPLSNQA